MLLKLLLSLFYVCLLFLSCKEFINNSICRDLNRPFVFTKAVPDQLLCFRGSSVCRLMNS